jgi:hypothetical protein
MTGGPIGKNILSWVNTIVSSKGLLNTLAPIVPFPEIRPCSQVSAGSELIKPRSGTGNCPANDEGPAKIPTIAKATITNLN